MDSRRQSFRKATWVKLATITQKVEVLKGARKCEVQAAVMEFQWGQDLVDEYETPVKLMRR